MKAFELEHFNYETESESEEEADQPNLLTEVD